MTVTELLLTTSYIKNKIPNYIQSRDSDNKKICIAGNGLLLSLLRLLRLPRSHPRWLKAISGDVWPRKMIVGRYSCNRQAFFKAKKKLILAERKDRRWQTDKSKKIVHQSTKQERKLREIIFSY